MFLNLQIRYVVDSPVEFVTCRKALTTRESKETGHYICYKYVNGILLRFHDALVNRVDLLYQYNINLIMYRWYDIDAHKWKIELGFVEHLNQVAYGLRRPPIHGTRYSLCHRDITEHERNPNGSVIAQKANTNNVGNSGEEPLDMRNKEQNTITTSLTSQQVPVDMTVSRETVPVNTTDDSDPKNFSGDSENNHNNSSETTTPQTPTSKEGELENSSPKAVDCSTEVDSQGKIQLSEFEETVDYNTGELSDDGDSSSSSSSGRSPDENDKDEPVNKKRKPDLSLRPPLITKSTGNTPKPE